MRPELGNPDYSMMPMRAANEPAIAIAGNPFGRPAAPLSLSPVGSGAAPVLVSVVMPVAVGTV